MALKIRLRQQGSRNRTTYRLVVADNRAPRDGKYHEAIGWYQPQAKEDMQLFVKEDRLSHWLQLGAELSERAALLVKRAAPVVFQALKAKAEHKKKKQAEKRKARKVAS
jgi:small subunit ribosomal protein S16